MTFEIFDFLILIGVLQGLFFALAILFSKYFKSKTNIYLGISLLIGVLVTIQSLALKYEWYATYPKFRMFEDIELVLLFPVTLYLYYTKFMYPGLRLKRKYIYLFIPFFLSLVVNLYMGGYAYFDVYVIENTTWISNFYTIEFYFSIVLNIVLLIVAYFLLFKKTKSDTELINHDLKWIKIFYSFHVLLIVTWIVLEIIDNLYADDFSFVLWLLLNFLFYWVGYIGIFKFRLSSNRYEIRKIIDAKEIDKLKQTRHEKTENIYFQNFIRLLEEDKIYRDSKISRNDIAERLEISVGYLSQIISGNSEKSFSDCVNFYRTEDVKRMVLDDEFNKYSILAIGLEAGYNSKSAFYTGFKKETGMTPSEYKNRHQKS